MCRLGLLLSYSMIVFACTAKAPAPPEHDFQPRPNYLTMGDAAAGRAVFLELKCSTCHDVAGERLAGKISNPHGPQLGAAEASQTADEIARAIAAPDHSSSKKPGPWREIGGPHMIDYTRVMTVRQLMDLVAYIRSLPGGGT